MIALVITITTSRPLDTTAPSRFWRYVLPSRISVAFHCKQLDVKGKFKKSSFGILPPILEFKHGSRQEKFPFWVGDTCIFVLLKRDSGRRMWYKLFKRVSSMIPLLEMINVAKIKAWQTQHIYIYLEPEWPLFWFWLGRFFGRVKALK